MITSDIQKKIDFIMDYFDFNKVKSVVDFLGWEWHNHENGTLSIPDIPQIRTMARQLIHGTLFRSENQEYTMTESGGFRVEVFRHDGDLNIAISFVLAQWETH